MSNTDKKVKSKWIQIILKMMAFKFTHENAPRPIAKGMNAKKYYKE